MANDCRKDPADGMPGFWGGMRQQAWRGWKHQFVQENLTQMFCEFKSCALDQ